MSDDEYGLADVIPIRAKNDEMLDFGVIRHSLGGCFQHHPVVFFEERRIECQRCKKTLDPYDVLANYIRNWSRVRHAFRAEEQARDRLAELLRKERNAKARLRRTEKP